MNRTRIALIGTAAVLLAVWAASASLPSAAPARDAADAAAKKRAARDAPPPEPLFDVDRAADRLRTRRDTMPPPAARRNPFEYDLAPVRSAARRTEPPPAVEVEPDQPRRPLFTLSGVAEKDGVRTAVIAGFGQLFFAKAGDTVASRYEVIAVGADAVELRDTYDGQTLRLLLR